MAKKPQLDEATRRIAERMLSMPPKPHDEMKINKAKADRKGAPRQSRRNPRSQQGGSRERE